MAVPKDPVILLSYINTKMRDDYSDLDSLCDGLNIDKQSLIEKLASINYVYDAEKNCFN